MEARTTPNWAPQSIGGWIYHQRVGDEASSNELHHKEKQDDVNGLSLVAEMRVV